MEDEEDIFEGDVVTCVVRVVRANRLPAGVTAEQVMEQGLPQQDEQDEQDEQEEAAQPAEPAEAIAEMTEQLELEPGVVLSQR